MTRFDTGATLQIKDESEIQTLLRQTEEPVDARAVASLTAKYLPIKTTAFDVRGVERVFQFLEITSGTG
jgi:hypothetical protein